MIKAKNVNKNRSKLFGILKQLFIEYLVDKIT